MPISLTLPHRAFPITAMLTKLTKLQFAAIVRFFLQHMRQCTILSLFLVVQGFFDGRELQYGYEVKIAGDRLRKGIKELVFKPRSPRRFWRKDTQTEPFISSQRRSIDPHEYRTVYVGRKG